MEILIEEATIIIKEINFIKKIHQIRPIEIEREIDNNLLEKIFY